MDTEPIRPGKKRDLFRAIFIAIILALAVGGITGALMSHKFAKKNQADVKTEVQVVKSPAQPETTIQLSPEATTTTVVNDKGELVEESFPTVEEVDGGGYMSDAVDFSDLPLNVYGDRGEIEAVDTSSPEAFKNSTLGRCIIANNYWGAQCVSLARAFWFDYAGYDVSTCGTGLAKGMMICAEDNARDYFEIIYDTKDIEAGTWVVLDGSSTGHVGMALGQVNANGYVAFLGENQGGASCGVNVGGSATNIINLSMKNFLGGYKPKAYIKVQPEPEPENLPEASH